MPATPRAATACRLQDGKPIKLRFWTLADNVQEQTAGKMMAGWFRELGLTIDFEVIDTGALISRVYNYVGPTYKPDFDMYLWYWDGFSDPGITLGTFATAAIGGNNEPGWSNAEFDGLNDEQMRTFDVEQRKGLIWQQQEVMYEETPQIPVRVPALPAGLQHGQVDRVDPGDERQRPGLLGLRQPRQLPQAQADVGDRERGERRRLCHRLDSRRRRRSR